MAERALLTLDLSGSLSQVANNWKKWKRAFEEGVCKVLTACRIPTMNVSIDGIVQEVLIDSGSVSNLMGKDDFQKLKNAGFKGNLKHCSRKLFA